MEGPNGNVVSRLAFGIQSINTDMSIRELSFTMALSKKSGATTFSLGLDLDGAWGRRAGIRVNGNLAPG